MLWAIIKRSFGKKPKVCSFLIDKITLKIPEKYCRRVHMLHVHKKVSSFFIMCFT